MDRLSLSIAVFVAALLSFPGIGSADPIKIGANLLQAKKGELTLKSLPNIPLAQPLKIKFKGKPLKGKAGQPNKKFKGNKKFGKTDIKLGKLSLKSSAPVKIKGKTKYNVFASLDKKKGRESKGSVKIKSHDDKKGGGQFLMTLAHLFLQIDFVPIANASTVLPPSISYAFDAGPVQSRGGIWSHEPGPGYPEPPAGNFFAREFSLGNDIFSLSSVTGASVPLPATLLLIGSGLMLMGFARKRSPAA